MYRIGHFGCFVKTEENIFLRLRTEEASNLKRTYLRAPCQATTTHVWRKKCVRCQITSERDAGSSHQRFSSAWTIAPRCCRNESLLLPLSSVSSSSSDLIGRRRKKKGRTQFEDNSAPLPGSRADVVSNNCPRICLSPSQARRENAATLCSLPSYAALNALVAYLRTSLFSWASLSSFRWHAIPCDGRADCSLGSNETRSISNVAFCRFLIISSWIKMPVVVVFGVGCTNAEGPRQSRKR